VDAALHVDPKSAEANVFDGAPIADGAPVVDRDLSTPETDYRTRRSISPTSLSAYFTRSVVAARVTRLLP
jgi:hypothetical protein